MGRRWDYLPNEFIIRGQLRSKVIYCYHFSKWVMEDISNVIDRNQYGGIRGSSTAHCLIEILDLFFKGTDKGKNVGTLVVTDFSKAFDCIDHTLAIQRLFELGVRCELLPWITNFLTSRRQRVQYHSALSQWETLSCGVPEGTKLGPIIFMAVINNASEESLAKSFKYVDDISLVEVRPAHQPSRLGWTFETWMSGQKTTASGSILVSARLCRFVL